MILLRATRSIGIKILHRQNEFIWIEIIGATHTTWSVRSLTLQIQSCATGCTRGRRLKAAVEI